MSYNRFFMPLACETRGFEFKARTPAGRCIIETRGEAGKLSLTAQDLKPETRYHVYLIFPQEARYAGILAGQLNVCQKGRGELKKDISQVDLNGFPLEKIIAIAVIAPDAQGVASPLCGYRDVPISWRHGFFVSGKKKEPAAEAPEITEVEALVEEVSEEVSEEASEDVSGDVSEDVPEEIFVDASEEIPEGDWIPEEVPQEKEKQNCCHPPDRPRIINKTAPRAKIPENANVQEAMTRIITRMSTRQSHKFSEAVLDD